MILWRQYLASGFGGRCNFKKNSGQDANATKN
jgi:hypothetical protein